MPSMRHHFRALLERINPSETRLELASTLSSEVREWLKDHDFATVSPHSRLIGSYSRDTAILNIKDVDILLFVPESQLDRTPNALLLELTKLLSAYPDSSVNAVGQRRSVRLEFPAHELHLDIVPAVLTGSLENPLKVPDRPREKWIDSDPLGYGRRLSRLNGETGGKIVPLMKLQKAWRDVQMTARRPKSYVLEVMVLCAAEESPLQFDGESMAGLVAQFFAHIADKYKVLMENGSGAPRIPDPQVEGKLITTGWSRECFETFMRRINEAKISSLRATQAATTTEAEDAWTEVFGTLWPSGAEVKATAREEASLTQPGVALVGATGAVIGTSHGVPSLPTRFHGGE